jgi:hypothetical protein
MWDGIGSQPCIIVPLTGDKEGQNVSRGPNGVEHFTKLLLRPLNAGFLLPAFSLNLWHTL